MMPRSLIERLYGVPLPIDVLWSHLSERLGVEATNELRAIQRLMLNDYPGIERVDQLFAYAVRRLAEK